jgi:hypothetical protein
MKNLPLLFLAALALCKKDDVVLTQAQITPEQRKAE